MNMKRIQEIAESWVNGNRSWVRNEVKRTRMQKLDFVYLLTAITGMDTRGDIEEVAHAILQG